jgi:hypothetical protein
MPTTEGGLETGWLVLFSQSETAAMAKSMERASSLSRLVLEPTTAAMLTAASFALTAAAKVAKRRGLSLGVMVKTPSFAATKAMWLPAHTLFSTAPIPFLYAETDPTSLHRWRQRLDLAPH